MPRGRPTRLSVTLTPAERAPLHAWQRSTTIPMARARRGRILLLLEGGCSVSQVASTVGIARRFVYKWVRRFAAQGLAGLYDQPRLGLTHHQWEETP